MNQELIRLKREVYSTKEPSILQVANWCKRAAEATKRKNRILSDELFIMAEICYNHGHISLEEANQFKNDYYYFLKGMLSKNL